MVALSRSGREAVADRDRHPPCSESRGPYPSAAALAPICGEEWRDAKCARRRASGRARCRIRGRSLDLLPARADPSRWATFSWCTCGAQCLKIPANQQLLPVCGRASLPLLPHAEVGEGPAPALTTDESEGLPGTGHRVMEPTANTRSRRRCSRPKNAEARWPFGPRASTPQRSHADAVAGNQDTRSACPSVAPLRARVVLPPKHDS
jgi:hypothetical protein